MNTLESGLDKELGKTGFCQDQGEQKCDGQENNGCPASWRKHFFFETAKGEMEKSGGCFFLKTRTERANRVKKFENRLP